MRKYRPKNPMMKKCYDIMMTLARDIDSELYLELKNPNKAQSDLLAMSFFPSSVNRIAHRGGANRCGFWDGFYEVDGCPVNIGFRIPATFGHACYRAGVDFRAERDA